MLVINTDKKLFGLKKLNSKQNILFVIVVAILCMGCYYDHFNHLYLRHIPPHEKLYGEWCIDTDRTVWPKVETLIKNKEIDPHRCYLRIEPEQEGDSYGKFILEGLPDTSPYSTNSSIKQGISASGEWFCAPDCGDGIPFLKLHFSIESCPAGVWFFFRKDGGEYFLHAIIGDPDCGEALVLRKI